MVACRRRCPASRPEARPRRGSARQYQHIGHVVSPRDRRAPALRGEPHPCRPRRHDHTHPPLLRLTDDELRRGGQAVRRGQAQRSRRRTMAYPEPLWGRSPCGHVGGGGIRAASRLRCRSRGRDAPHLPPVSWKQSCSRRVGPLVLRGRSRSRCSLLLHPVPAPALWGRSRTALPAVPVGARSHDAAIPEVPRRYVPAGAGGSLLLGDPLQGRAYRRRTLPGLQRQRNPVRRSRCC